MEGIVTDLSHRVGDDDTGQTDAGIERKVTDLSYRVGDNSVLAASNQLIIGGLDNCIAVVARIKPWIATFYHDAGQPRAVSERLLTDLSYRVGDDDAGQFSAPSERSGFDRSYRVGGFIVGNGGRDDDIA